ncbi:unnamed protein product, partial [Linum tenue]
MIFCSRYLSENGDTRFTRPSRNYEGFVVEANPGELFPITGRPLGAKRNGKGNLIEMNDEVLIQAQRYVIINCQDNLPELSAYIKFHTLGHEKNLQTQSSGVTLTAMTSSYASSKDKNPVLANVSYYGAIE